MNRESGSIMMKNRAKNGHFTYSHKISSFYYFLV